MAGGSLSGKGGRKKTISEINVTPLVDIMLVLLIIFMVTASYIVRDQIRVNLPEASTGEPSKVTLLGLTINAKGELFLNGKPTDDGAIRAFIKQSKAKGEALEAVIGADKSASHGSVVRVLDLVRAEGVKKFGITVLKPKQGN